jgi:hypothetical protein
MFAETTHPSRALLYMSIIRLWHRTMLQRLRNEASLPASSKQSGGTAHILGQTFDREASDVFDGGASHDVARAQAVSVPKRVMYDFSDTAELMHGLNQGIVGRAVVEGLRRELSVTQSSRRQILTNLPGEDKPSPS